MTGALSEAVFAVFLLFCRIGGCIMFAPGLSSARISPQIRLLVALALTLSLSPLAFAAVSGASGEDRVALVISETLTGSVIGLMGRFLFLGLQFAATVIANMIGLAGIPGMPLDEPESGSPLATLASSAAVMTVLSLGLHLEMLEAILDSYVAIPVSAAINPEAQLKALMTVAAEAWLLSLRLAAPFIAYGIVVNLAVGLANRFTPQISVYHATTGLVMLGGFFLLFLLWGEWMTLFTGAYRGWLLRGGF